MPFRRGAGCDAGTRLSPPWRIQGVVKGSTITINFDEKDGSGEVFDGDYVTRGGEEGILLPDGTFWVKIGDDR